MRLNEPVFCLTADWDWASDYCLQDFVGLAARHGIRPTVFATHRSPALADLAAKNAIEVGLHPNFLPGSTHGQTPEQVIEHMFGLFPGARGFRSHSFFDSSPVCAEMRRRGTLYDSNLCLYLQPDLVPLRHWSGLTRFPVFWEDDVHWHSPGDCWDAEALIETFLTPGLKVLNFHPFNVALNVPNQEFYGRVKPHVQTLGSATAEALRFRGPGTRSFLTALLDALTARGERFLTLDEAFRALPADGPTVSRDDTRGRASRHSAQDHENYWRMNDEEKQRFLRESYEHRNALDRYATSRDANLRELEIRAIAGGLNGRGPILDLGCGNGYTLISIAKSLAGTEMVGVDFSDNLIRGALALVEQETASLRSAPRFLCADAIEHLRRCASGSLGCVVTERFLLNLPSAQLQRAVIRDAYRALTPGGRLLMCEGSNEGFRALNGIRESVGLAPIPETSADNVTALRFDDRQIEDFAQREVGFRLVGKRGFSQFFIISRVLHPLLAAPLPPRFDARINDLARRVQEAVPDEPGVGANTLWMLEKPQA